MSVTAVYSRSHVAFRDAGKAHGIDPFDVRVLVALLETVDPAVAEVDLAAQLGCQVEAIRRSAHGLAAARLVHRHAPGRGRRSTLRLTAGGTLAARDALRRAGAQTHA